MAFHVLDTKGNLEVREELTINKGRLQTFDYLQRFNDHARGLSFITT